MRYFPVILDLMAEIVHRSLLNYEQFADLSSFPKGLYFITIIHPLTKEHSVHKVSLQ
jgi:hypothetical protein